MITALALAVDKEQKEQRAGLDTSSWRIKGTDAETVTRELRTLLQQSGGHVADLLKIFDQDNTNEMRIDDLEFFTGMREKCGFRGPKHIIDDVFTSLDVDKSGYISFDELFEVLLQRFQGRCLATGRLFLSPTFDSRTAHASSSADDDTHSTRATSGFAVSYWSHHPRRPSHSHRSSGMWRPSAY